MNETLKTLNITLFLKSNKILRTTGLKLDGNVKNKIAFVCLDFFLLNQKLSAKVHQNLNLNLNVPLEKIYFCELYNILKY